jgi:hypothetical protein
VVFKGEFSELGYNQNQTTDTYKTGRKREPLEVFPYKRKIFNIVMSFPSFERLCKNI